jgi:hypothetical protein
MLLCLLLTSACFSPGLHCMLLPCALQECLGHIIAALDAHQGEVDIQTKGLVLLGVLIQVRTAGSRVCCWCAVVMGMLMQVWPLRARGYMWAQLPSLTVSAGCAAGVLWWWGCSYKCGLRHSVLLGMRIQVVMGVLAYAQLTGPCAVRCRCALAVGWGLNAAGSAEMLWPAQDARTVQGARALWCHGWAAVAQQLVL